MDLFACLLTLPKLLMNCLRSLRIIIKEKPDVLITTGVLAMIPVSFLTKHYGHSHEEVGGFFVPGGDSESMLSDRKGLSAKDSDL